MLDNVPLYRDEIYPIEIDANLYPIIGECMKKILQTDCCKTQLILFQKLNETFACNS